MLCMILADLERNPTPEMSRWGDVRKQLGDSLRESVWEELLENTRLDVKDLCNNQSDIRDYWAKPIGDKHWFIFHLCTRSIAPC